jgi:transposase
VPLYICEEKEPDAKILASSTVSARIELLAHLSNEEGVNQMLELIAIGAMAGAAWAMLVWADRKTKAKYDPKPLPARQGYGGYRNQRRELDAIIARQTANRLRSAIRTMR